MNVPPAQSRRQGGEQSAVESLETREDLLSLAEAAAGIGVWDHELATGLVRGTVQFFRIMGLEPTSQPVSQDSIRALRHPEDRDRVLMGYRKSLADGLDTYETEYRIIRPDGQVRWIFGRGRTTRDASGTPIRYSGVDIDITALKETQERLRLSEERFSKAFNSAAHPMSISTLSEGRYVAVNAAALAASGMRREDVIGRTTQELGFYEDPDRFRLVRELIARDGQFTDLETDLKGATGTKTFLLSGAPIELDGEQCLLVSAIDITARKRAEEALRVSEARLELSVRVAGLGIFDHDHRTDTVYWSPELREICGWDLQQEADAAGYVARSHGEDRPAVIRALQQAKDPAGDGTAVLEHRLLLPDGTVRWVAMRAQTIFESVADARRPERTIGAVLDISARRKSEDHIRLLMQEVNHRSNNLLSVVQAVVQQTAQRSDPRQFAELLASRIGALSASHNLLVSEQWRGAPMRELVHSQLAHFADLVGSRVSIEGPSVRVMPAAARAIGMALYELATNAGKYGALSNDKGIVRIAWDLSETSGDRRFRVQWSESDGPPVEPPSRTGFGHSVTVRMMESALGGKASLEFKRGGIVWEVVCPLDNVVEQH